MKQKFQDERETIQKRCKIDFAENSRNNRYDDNPNTVNQSSDHKELSFVKFSVDRLMRKINEPAPDAEDRIVCSGVALCLYCLFSTVLLMICYNKV